jgi:beta-aspartyl-peptidase (threonine type)
MQILCHAGAWNTTDQTKISNEERAVKAAIAVGRVKLTLIDAIEATINSLENDADLDAGLGSNIQMDGRVRMDSAMADSKNRYGAVIQIEQIQNPVSVARKILELEYHHILSGDGALSFALEQGFPRRSVYTRARLETFLNQRHEVPELTYQSLVEQKAIFDKKKLSTVGAVGINEEGYLVAATSTGGLSYGYPGRVGDSALLGHGIYCSENVAVACTGHGEIIIRSMMAKRVEDYYIQYKDLQKAVDAAIADLGKAGGQGGIIAAAKDGQMAVAYNTTFLATAKNST